MKKVLLLLVPILLLSSCSLDRSSGSKGTEDVGFEFNFNRVYFNNDDDHVVNYALEKVELWENHYIISYALTNGDIYEEFFRINEAMLYTDVKGAYDFKWEKPERFNTLVAGDFGRYEINNYYICDGFFFGYYHQDEDNSSILGMNFHTDEINRYYCYPLEDADFAYTK